MPKLDLTQLFWFFICFTTLYVYASSVILPRIRNILKDRKSVIDADTSSASELNDRISSLHSKTDSLRKNANQKYQAKLEEVSKEASLKREKMLEELKDKVEQITEKSRHDLKNFIAKSRSDSESAIKDLSQKIKEKLLT